DEVAPPQASRLLGEAEQPLEPDALDETGGRLLDPGVEVERRTDRYHRAAQGLGVPGDEVILAWSTEADPQDVGSGLRHPREELSLLLGLQLSERRRLDADDLHPGESLAQRVGEAGHRIRRGA